MLDSEGIDPNTWDECVEKADRKFRGQTVKYFESAFLKNDCYSIIYLQIIVIVMWQKC